jgi:hypothetical protein
MKFIIYQGLNSRFHFIYKYIRFIFIGILSNIISYILFTLLISLKFNIDISASCGMVAGVFNTYILSRLYLNKSAVVHSNIRMLIFFSYYSVAIFLTSFSIEWLTLIKKIDHNFSWLICTVIASFINFVFVSKIALYIKRN